MPWEETAMHTIEIAGRPTLVVNHSKEEVQDLLTDSWLLEDLSVLETQGQPLWFGQRKDFLVRLAAEGKASQWEETFSRALSEGHVTEDEEDNSLDEP
jgi:hypothetical protein